MMKPNMISLIVSVALLDQYCWTAAIRMFKADEVAADALKSDVAPVLSVSLAPRKLTRVTVSRATQETDKKTEVLHFYSCADIHSLSALTQQQYGSSLSEITNYIGEHPVALPLVDPRAGTIAGHVDRPVLMNNVNSQFLNSNFFRPGVSVTQDEGLNIGNHLSGDVIEIPDRALIIKHPFDLLHEGLYHKEIEAAFEMGRILNNKVQFGGMLVRDSVTRFGEQKVGDLNGLFMVMERPDSRLWSNEIIKTKAFFANFAQFITGSTNGARMTVNAGGLMQQREVLCPHRAKRLSVLAGHFMKSFILMFIFAGVVDDDRYFAGNQSKNILLKYAAFEPTSHYFESHGCARANSLIDAEGGEASSEEISAAEDKCLKSIGNDWFKHFDFDACHTFINKPPNESGPEINSFQWTAEPGDKASLQPKRTTMLFMSEQNVVHQRSRMTTFTAYQHEIVNQLKSVLQKSFIEKAGVDRTQPFLKPRVFFTLGSAPTSDAYDEGILVSDKDFIHELLKLARDEARERGNLVPGGRLNARWDVLNKIVGREFDADYPGDRYGYFRSLWGG